MAHVYDYSWSHPDPQKMASVPGCLGVARYLSWHGSKDLTAAEAEAVHAAGLAVTLVWETSASREEGGHDAGVADATTANQQADELGFPSDCVIFYADDQNDPDPAAEIEYMRGVASVSRRPWGEYGNSVVCAWALENGGYAWQVETWNRPVDEAAEHLTQLANTKAPYIPDTPESWYDTNIVNRPFPMWGPGGTINGAEVTPEQMTELKDTLLSLTYNAVKAINTVTKEQLFWSTVAIGTTITREVRAAAQDSTPVDVEALATELAAELADKMPKPPSAKHILDSLKNRLETDPKV